MKDEKTAASVKLPLRSPLGFGFGFGLGLGVRRYGDRGWCGAPKHVDPMARHVHDMRARRRDGRTARPPHHALLVSARGRRGVVPPPEAAPGWSMVRWWLGAQWAGLSPGSGSPPRAARGALRGRRIRAGAQSRLPFDHAAAHGWQPHVARVHGRESKRRAERDVRSQRQSQRVRPATQALVGAHQQCGAANRKRLRATVVAYVVNKAPVWPAHAGDQAADWPRLGEALGGLGHKLAQK